MTVRSILTAIVLLTAFVSLLKGQQATRGIRVVVRSAAEPVTQATVVLGSRGALTDARGEALLRIPPGTWALRIERIGFATHTDTLIIAAATQDTTITVQLEEEAIEEEEIVVTSTRGERRVQDEPVKVEVVTREEVEEKLLMTPGSIAMLLNETAGLRVQEASPALGGATIRVQGLRGRYTQLLSDGLPLYGSQSGSFGLLQIPPMDLGQVEVIKGAASALYGSSALGGAVNLISRRPDDQTELLLNQTTRGGTDAVLWQAGPARSALSYTLLASGHAQEQRDIDRDSWSDLPRYRRLALRPRLFWNGAGGARVMATAGFMGEVRRGGGQVGTGESLRQELHTTRFDAGTSALFPLSSGPLLDLRASGSLNGHDHTFGATQEIDVHGTAFAEASLRGNSGAHNWVLGAALQRDTYHSQDVRGFDFAYWLPALFVQDEIIVNQTVAASLSVRYDHHSEYGRFIAPRASLLLRPTTNTSIRASAGQGYFGPTPFTEETEEVGLGRVTPPGNLQAERARVASLDVGWTSGAFELNGSVFGSLVNAALAVVPAGARLTLVNLPGDTRTMGAEALVRYKAEPFAVTATYTRLAATQPTSFGAREAAPMIPRHSAGLVAVLEDHEKGRAGLEVYYTGRQQLQDNPYRSQSRGYLITGMLFERRLGRWRAFLNLENLTDVRQTRFDPLLRPAPTSFGRWSTDLWAPVDGRTFNGGLRVQL